MIGASPDVPFWDRLVAALLFRVCRGMGVEMGKSMAPGRGGSSVWMSGALYKTVQRVAPAVGFPLVSTFLAVSNS